MSGMVTSIGNSEFAIVTGVIISPSTLLLFSSKN
jgi:hypothetical protein